MHRVAGEETVAIRAPAGRVWAYRLDFTRLPEYNPDVTDLVRLEEGDGPGGTAGAGSRYRFTLATAAGPHTVTLAVVHVVEDREVTATMEGGLSARETFTVTPNGDDRCRATLLLSVDVPEGWDPATVDGVLAGGRRQIRDELDAMATVLGARPVGT